jgi:hypothetical protein
VILAASDASDFERMVARLVQADEHALLLMLSADAARSVPVFSLVLHGTFINKKVIIRSLPRFPCPSLFPPPPTDSSNQKRICLKFRRLCLKEQSPTPLSTSVRLEVLSLLSVCSIFDPMDGEFYGTIKSSTKYRIRPLGDRHQVSCTCGQVLPLPHSPPALPTTLIDEERQ